MDRLHACLLAACVPVVRVVPVAPHVSRPNGATIPRMRIARTDALVRGTARQGEASDKFSKEKQTLPFYRVLSPCKIA
jgi:hypothetical protein